jgi:hypothetical protein
VGVGLECAYHPARESQPAKDVMANVDDPDNDEAVGIDSLPEDEVIPDDVDPEDVDPEDLDEAAIEDNQPPLEGNAYGDDEVADDGLDDAAPIDDNVVVTEEKPAPPRTRRAPETEDDEEDEDEVDDDVEADLDTILKDRIAAQPDDADEDEEDEQPEPEERGDGPGRLQPRRPGEFACQSCFLVKHPSQLADPENMLCSDCV